MGQAEFEELYRKYYQMVFGFVKKRVTGKEMAEDLTSEIFEKAFTTIERYDESKCSFQTWLFVITNNHLKNYYRDKKEVVSFEEEPGPALISEASVESVVELQEMREVLKKALLKLPERDMEIVLCRYYEDMTAVQIGKRMGLTSGNVRIILKRALEKLRKILNEECV